jgi:hypothetical protein
MMYADGTQIDCIAQIFMLMSVPLTPLNRKSPLSASAAAPGIVVAISGIASSKCQYMHACDALVPGIVMWI